jgi:predicted alpha-1,2-mannosidase
MSTHTHRKELNLNDLLQTCRRTSIFCMTVATTLGVIAAEPTNPVDYINPVIGNSAQKRCGRTIPGPHIPFGLVQLSPDTVTGKGKTSGYNWYDKTIEGFSVNRMPGVGYHGSLGNFQVMPTTGKLLFHSGSNTLDQHKHEGPGWKSPFSHDDVVAKPGYYSVFLKKYGITAELTATQRVGMMRFTFPASHSSHIQIDLARKIGGYSGRQHNIVVANGTIKGKIRCWGEGAGFAKGTKYNLYYYAQFDKKWDSYGLWNRGDDLGEKPDVENDDLGFHADFTTTSGEQITLKIGISYVSMEGAQANLEQELAHWDFDAVKTAARQTWKDEIDGMLITRGGTEDQKMIFYSALYRTMMYPLDFTDVDGNYWGADKKVHGGKNYTTRMGFSGWDVYKHEFPLLTIIRPDIVNDQVNTFLDICNLTGKTYPLWQMMGDYTGAGLGDPGLSVTVDAYMKGIQNFDLDRAYAIALQTASGPDSVRKEYEKMNDKLSPMRKMEAWSAFSKMFPGYAKLIEEIKQTDHTNMANYLQRAEIFPSRNCCWPRLQPCWQRAGCPLPSLPRQPGALRQPACWRQPPASPAMSTLRRALQTSPTPNSARRREPSCRHSSRLAASHWARSSTPPWWRPVPSVAPTPISALCSPLPP